MADLGRAIGRPRRRAAGRPDAAAAQAAAPKSAGGGEAADRRLRRLWGVDTEILGPPGWAPAFAGRAAVPLPRQAAREREPGGERPAAAARADPADRDAEAAVTELYRAHALGLARLAHVMLGDRSAAEDVVQEAFCGLYRRWKQLADQDKALRYARSAVLNGCRSVLRRRIRQQQAFTGRAPGPAGDPAPSAEAAVLASERNADLLAALRKLPDRQREALVLRYYADLGEADIAAAMGIRGSTVRSTITRGLTALGRLLEEPR